MSMVSTAKRSATGNGRGERVTTQLESLRRWSVIVADTGDIDAFGRFHADGRRLVEFAFGLAATRTLT